MTQWKLIIEDDAGKTIVVPLTRDEITIGRKEGNTIRLTERNVSRDHAKLTKVNGMVSIEDLKSFNGIKINGDRINGLVNVREGDLIEIGDYHLALQAEGAPESTSDRTQTTLPPKEAAATVESPAIKGPVGSQAGAVGYDLPEAADDEFAGDTQRWDPPANMDPVSMGMPTLADGEALAAEPTQQQRMPPPDDEATIRNPAIAPAAPSPSFSQLSGEKTEAMNPNPSDEATVPHMAAAPVHSTDAPTPAQMPEPASHDSMGAKDEMTEQIRAVPGLKQDLGVPRLVVLNSMFAGSTYHVQGAVQTMGRTDDNDITIGHRSVSRNHAKIVRDGNHWAIHDMQSANGILVNDQEVDGFKLSSGDIIELGRVRVRFVPPGESFSLTSSEVEVARRKAALGEDDESPNAPMQKSGNSSTLLIAAGMGAIILLLLAVVALLLFKDNGKSAELVKEPALVAKADKPVKNAANAQKKNNTQKANAKKADAQKAAQDKKAAAKAAKLEKAAAAKEEKAQKAAAAKEKAAEKAAVKEAKAAEARRKGKGKGKRGKTDRAKAEEYFRQGTSAQLKGQVKKARDLLLKAIKNAPRHADAHRNLGVVYSRLGENAKAYRYYSRYLVLDPNAQDRVRVKAILDKYDKERGR